MMIPIANASRMPAAAIGSKGISRLRLTAVRRAPFPEPVRAPAFVLVFAAITTVEYRPTLSGLGRRHVVSDRPGPEPIGRRSPLRDYEVLYIVRADLDDDKVQDAVKRVNTLIERSGGAVERTNLWGKRKLAYEVKHQKEGSYVLQDFQFDPGRVPELEAALKITEEVLRHLIVRKPEKAAVATVVAPPPAEVVLEPIAVESEAVVPAARADREES